MSTIGHVLLGLGVATAVMNFYLSFLRPPLLLYFGKECPHVSGWPLMGSLFLIAALSVVRTPLAWTLAIVAALLDTGGLV